MHAGCVLTKQIILKMKPTMLCCSPLTWKTARAILTLALLKKQTTTTTKTISLPDNRNIYRAGRIYSISNDRNLFHANKFCTKKTMWPLWFNVERRKKYY